jgi:hypothetical protein
MARIRIYQLREGDVFELWGLDRRVKFVQNGRMYYANYDPGGYSGFHGIDSMGRYSNMFVNLKVRDNAKVVESVEAAPENGSRKELGSDPGAVSG